MAGQLTIDTLKASSGVLATQNGMTGIAKAWVQFVGNTAVINGSFNVSSVTRVSTGVYRINYTTDMTNTAYSLVVSPGMNSGGTYFGNTAAVFCNQGTNVPPTTSSSTFTTANPSAGVIDPYYVNVAVFGA